MKFSFKDIPDRVNQPFTLPEPGTYSLVITNTEFKPSSTGGLNLNIETTIKGSNNKFTTFSPMASAIDSTTGKRNLIQFGVARLKRILAVLNKIPEMEIELTNETHQALIISFLNGGEFIADLQHRTYKNNQGVDATALEVVDWDNLRPVEVKTIDPTPQVNKEVVELVEDEDII